MINLLNVLYLTNPDYYIKREGKNIVVTLDGRRLKSFPIHIFRQIVLFNYVGLSPGAMKLCMENNVMLTFFTPYGKYCGRVVGSSYGNINNRKKQYELANSEESLGFVKNIIYAKAYNSRKVLIRGKLDNKEKVDKSKLEFSIEFIKEQMKEITKANNKDTIRGIEGNIAREYFSALDELIVKQREDFFMIGRTKRPPMDEFNALLSFMYSIFTNEVTAALEGVGVDPYAGFFHTDRSGRYSMSLDIIEEFRSVIIDKFCLSLINYGRINKKHFIVKENGATFLNDKGRDTVLEYWNKREHDELQHYYLDKKVKVGLLPHIQAQLLNSYIRGDIPSYPPYMQKD